MTLDPTTPASAEELASRAAKEARDRLVADNAAFAVWTAVRVVRGAAAGRRLSPALARQLTEDAVQAALVVMVRAAELYDPARGVKFITYAARLVRRAAMWEVARESFRGVAVPHRKLTGPDRPRFRFEGLDAGTDDDRYAREPAAPEPRDAPEFPPDFWDRVRRLLNERQYRFLVLRFRDGLTTRAAAERSGLKVSRARSALATAASTLRDAAPELAGYLSAGRGSGTR